MIKCSFTNLMVVISSPAALTYTSDNAPASNKEFLDTLANIECGFTLKCVLDMIITYSQMHGTDLYSQIRSIVGSV